MPALERLQRLIAVAKAAQISTLHHVFPKLERLEEVIAAERAEQMRGLDRFQIDESLKRLQNLAEKQRDEFDALDFIGRLRLGRGRDLWGWEEFHSSVLAWLLDPKQSHRLGDRFLKSFLLRSGVRPTGSSADWSATEVIREWEKVVDGKLGYLDILIVNEGERVLCAIENKVFSGEHSEQLTRYRKALEVAYPTFTKYHVFLTREGTYPFREEEKGHWTPLTYSMVFDILQEVVENKDNLTNEDVRAFLRQYAATLRRNLMPETSVSQLARKIYLEHREAMDLLVANRPDWVAEAKQMLREAIAEHPEWILDVEGSNLVRFRSGDWDQFKASQTGTGWAPGSHALLLFQFRFDDRLPWLDLGLSPGDVANNRVRRKLFESAQQRPRLLQTQVSLTD